MMDSSFAIEGKYCTLRLLDPLAHYADLRKNLNQPTLWVYFSSTSYLSEEKMLDYLIGLEADPRSTTYVICRKDAFQPLGFFSIVRGDGFDDTREFCNVMFSRQLQKTTMATEAVFLLLQVCFEYQRIKRVDWLANYSNQASKSAALRFGFQWIEFCYINGEGFWTSRMESVEWSRVRKQYQKWLDKSNFDSKGIQYSKLNTRKSI